MRAAGDAWWVGDTRRTPPVSSLRSEPPSSEVGFTRLRTNGNRKRVYPLSGRGGMGACGASREKKSIPASPTAPILVASPSAKGRAHEASCSVGRGAVSAVPVSHTGRRGLGSPPAEGDFRAPMPPKGSAKGRRRSATVGPVREIGHRDRGGLEAGRSARSRLAFVSGPRRGRSKNRRGGRSAERPIDYWPGTHRAPATPSCLRARGSLENGSRPGAFGARERGRMSAKCDPPAPPSCAILELMHGPPGTRELRSWPHS